MYIHMYKLTSFICNIYILTKSWAPMSWYNTNKYDLYEMKSCWHQTKLPIIILQSNIISYSPKVYTAWIRSWTWHILQTLLKHIFSYKLQDFFWYVWFTFGLNLTLLRMDYRSMSMSTAWTTPNWDGQSSHQIRDRLFASLSSNEIHQLNGYHLPMIMLSP